jgi:hypothetical protein
VVSRTLTAHAQDERVTVSAEPAVTARRVPVGEIPEQDQVGSSLGELVKSQGRDVSACVCLWPCLGWRRCLAAGVRRRVAVWHSGAVSQGRGRHPGPAKTAGGVRNRPPIGPAKPPGCAVLEAFVHLAPRGGRRPHHGSTEVNRRTARGATGPDRHQSTRLAGSQVRGLLLSDWLRAARVESGSNQSALL